MRRTIVERPPQKSRSVTTEFVTLQREPPLTRIFAPGFFAPSRSRTDRAGLKRRVKIAVASPAAPAPTITTSCVSGRARPVTPSLNHRAALAESLSGADGGRLGIRGNRDARSLAAGVT